MKPDIPALERPFHWLRAAARRRIVWLGLPLILYLWTLSGPFLFDDLTLLHNVDRHDAGETSSPELFRFAQDEADWQAFIDRGTLPWWSAARPVDFFRPLPERAFYADVHIFGRDPLLHRIASLAWFAIVLLLLHRLFMTVTRNADVAHVATLLFGLSQTVTQPVTFVCNRSDLFVLVAISIAAWAYWRAAKPANQKTRPRLILLALAGFAVALLCKEVAVAFAGVLCAHALLARFSRRSPRPSPSQTWIAVGCFVLAILYLGYYASTRIVPNLDRADGLGTMPAIADLPRIIGEYLAVWMLAFPINVLPQLPSEYTLGVVILAVLLTLGVLRSLIRIYRRDADRGIPFFALWAVMLMLPPLLSVPEPRALCVASAGWAFLLAWLLTPRGEPTSENAPAASLPLRHWLLTASVSISVICAICTVLVSNHLERDARAAMLQTVESLDPPLADGQTLLFTAPPSTGETPSPAVLLCAADRLEHITHRRNLSVYFLTAPGAIEAGTTVTRLDDATLRLSSPSHLLFDGPMHRLARSQAPPLHVGDTLETPAFTAEVSALRGDGTVEVLTLHLKRLLSDPNVRLIRPSPHAGNDPAEADSQKPQP